jgi:ATP citrate (pro-S)-lyase
MLCILLSILLCIHTTRAVQGMLDFDYMCKRAKPSVAAMVFPFSGNHYVKFYWGTSETLIPVYTSTEEAARRHPDVTVLVNFSSFRSVYDTTMDALQFSSQVRVYTKVVFNQLSSMYTTAV